MRVLVIGFPLPNTQFDNHTVLNAPAWYDYDAVVVEPESISQAIEDVLNRREEHTTRADEPVLNRPTSPLNVGLGDLIKQRRDEAGRLLANGGVIAVFARPEVVHEGVAGFPGCDRYAFLPAPPGVSYGAPFMPRAYGGDVHPTDSAHPMAAIFEKYRSWIAYRVRFDDNLPGFPSFAKVIARSPGGAAVGVELRVGGGTVIFLPAFGSLAYGDQRFELANMMLTGLRGCLGEPSEPAPTWTLTFALPGSPEAAAAEGVARDELEVAQAHLDEARAKVAELTKYRGLLWRGGRELEPIVRDAFRLLGFYVENDPDRPFVIRDAAGTAFVEVEGSSETVMEWPYFRLQKRLEQDLLKTKEPKKGVIVVNGERLVQPNERTQPVSETLRIAAENYRYALLTTGSLYDAVRAVLERPDDEQLRSTIRSRLPNASGATDLTPDSFVDPSKEGELDVGDGGSAATEVESDAEPGA